MEPDEQRNIPTTPATPHGPEATSPVPEVTDSKIGGLLGLAARRDRSNVWRPPEPTELQQYFPQFEIRGILGRGGMGAVYKAWQKSLDRFVAIKILPAGCEDGISEFTERFKREAKAMAHLKHPGIVSVYDAGETADGLRYFMMEYIEGTDLQKLLVEQGHLEPAEVVRIITHVCNALGYAHTRSVIHRDIKPSNIMLEPDGDVKVADFGLAKSTDGTTTMLTLSNVTMGTLEYMAPEATTGAANADHRADLYSVGVMLYKMLTGKLPRGKYDPPSEIVPGLDKRFDKIVDRALQPKPEARFQSARDFANALEPISRSANRREATGNSGTHARKSPVLIGIAPVMAIVGIVALAYFKPWKNEDDAPVVPPIFTGGEKPVSVLPQNATKTAPFVNSLGQEFVPVSGTPVLFCKWETRVRDYAAYVKASAKPVDDSWTRQEKKAENGGVPVGSGPDFPVCGVSWDEVRAFCDWLTATEHASGALPAGMSYRLPKDLEWSRAVGLPEEEGATPKERHRKNTTDYPWGTGFPPPQPRVGNYADSTFHSQFPKDKWMEGYTDGFATTAPVGSFPANQFGIHDLGGNVWEWCEEPFEPGSPRHIARGASWVNFTLSPLSSSRMDTLPDVHQRDLGFRVVLDLGEK